MTNIAADPEMLSLLQTSAKLVNDFACNKKELAFRPIWKTLTEKADHFIKVN